MLALISLHVAEINRMVGSCDILDVSSLQESTVTFYSPWEGNGEVKLMRAVAAHFCKGVGRAIVEHLIKVAKERRYTRLSLETGIDSSFESARRFYTNMGFELFDPYGPLAPCPDSSSMTLELES